MLTLFVILAILLQVAIALTVYFRRQQGHANTIFVLLSLSLAGWALSDYVAISIPQNANAIYAIRTVITFVIVQNTLFYLFANSYPDKKLKDVPYRRLVIGYSTFVLALSQSPWLFSSVTISNNTANPNPAPPILFFMIHAVATIALGLRALISKYRHAPTIVKHRQLLIILFGSIILWLITPITNFVLTLGLHTTVFVRITPFYTLAFGGLITYAIVSQKLFDIRATVARAVAYVLTVTMLAVVYTAIIFGVSNLITRGEVIDMTARVIYTVAALILAFSFSWIKDFFDQLSNRIFFRDAYDPQKFLNDLNDVLVEKIEVKSLLTAVSQIVETNLKSATTTFIIRKTAYYPVRIVGEKQIFDDHDLDFLGEHTTHTNEKVLATEQLKEQHAPLRRFLDKRDIAVVVRLVPNLEYLNEGVGYLLLGTKRNGQPYGKDDLSILEIIANELVIAIENGMRFEEIENFNSTLQDKVDSATLQLKRTNEKLKALDETKDEFISMASHQLRTPLTSVKGYLSMVLEGDAGELNDMQRKLLEQSFTSSQRMVYLIADLLNLSRLRTGKFVIDAAPSNLATVIVGELDQLRETLAAKNMTLTYDPPKDFPSLMLDETKIRQVIMNFIDNAIYYTPAGGNIVVGLRDKKDSIEFTVKDNGIGVPKNEQQHLFGKFYRAGNARKARPDGTGLGLFMAKKVIIAQGGAIVFKSTEGKGSTFGFEFSKNKLKVPEHLVSNK